MAYPQQDFPRPPHREFDILGIGNAIIDVIAATDPDFLHRHDMVPGSMALIDAARAETLTHAMPPGRSSSGGSVANSCAVAAQLGARVVFLGKVADDALGEAFRRDITAAGVSYPTAMLSGQAPTARCLILVTPDAQRTMNTYLGACVAFDIGDLDRAHIEKSAVTYLEGYLFDPPHARTAFHKAAEWAHEAGNQVALSLSDPFCVARHRAAFVALLPQVDVLFANENEICSLYECDTFEQASEKARQSVGVAVLTRSASGSIILSRKHSIGLNAVPGAVVDTTGAGDCYAAGFLTAYVKGALLEACGELAGRTAAACIAAYGARPDPRVITRLREETIIAAQPFT